MSEQATAGHGHRVRLEPDQDVAPPGVWRCVDRSPEPGRWWVQPADREASWWLAGRDCPLIPLQGCIDWPSRRMRPPDVAALF